MKTIILAGGLGTRLSEETENRPKPMVEIGGRPILWHVMKIYSYSCALLPCFPASLEAGKQGSSPLGLMVLTNLC